MDRIYEKGAAANPPAAPAEPSTGYPTAGDPRRGVPATVPGAWWHHMMAEEMATVIEAANLAPDHASLTQLRDAINFLIAAAGQSVLTQARATPVKWKRSCRAATTGNITLSGEQTIDGIDVIAGDRVLVKDQDAPAGNGIYAAAAGNWTRGPQADEWDDLVAAAIVVEEGDANADKAFLCTADRGGTLDTTAVDWTEFGTLAAPAAPPGAMMDYAGATAPNGWLPCNGQAVSRTTHADLFTAIGTTWGAGDDSTTFNVPDFRRRVAVGSGGASSDIIGNTVGDTGGAETHALTAAELGPHGHDIVFATYTAEGKSGVMLPLSGDGWRFQRLSVRFQSRLIGLSQMSFLGSARFIWVS